MYPHQVPRKFSYVPVAIILLVCALSAAFFYPALFRGSFQSASLIDPANVTETRMASDVIPAIEGAYVNPTNKRLELVSIEFALYAKDGSRVGTAVDSIHGLGPKERWQFKAVCTSQDAASYKIDRIMAY